MSVIMGRLLESGYNIVSMRRKGDASDSFDRREVYLVDVDRISLIRKSEGGGQTESVTVHSKDFPSVTCVKVDGSVESFRQDMGESLDVMVLRTKIECIVGKK